LKKQIANTNLQIVQCSTPANYFHALRRQIRRQYRKPLIAFESKRLLRYVKVVMGVVHDLDQSYSYLEEIDEGTRFNTVYPEKYPEKINKPD
jgi:2-oxoglutarate dehydrogenase E1 component